jgi:hypothetical protein
MALINLWKKDRSQLIEKHINQVITFAGEGKLTDDSKASTEFREYLRNIPSSLIAQYADQCLKEPFPDSGLALQDVVNEIGRRIGFKIVHGRYRGTSSHLGYDGIWTDESGDSIVVEVKTTDTYRIDLANISKYRQLLDADGKLTLEKSSMLIVVGRKDTGDLETQIRGSRYAWDMRVISVEALLKMLNLKEELEDPSIVSRIHQILIPHEFTRLDEIVHIAFAAVEDVKQDVDDTENQSEDKKEKNITPVAFHTECITRIEECLKLTLIKQSRVSFSSPDDKTHVLCSVSRY